jgi:hypothetical protein
LPTPQINANFDVISVNKFSYIAGGFHGKYWRKVYFLFEVMALNRLVVSPLIIVEG